jgi:hypothetical protein
MYDVVRYYLVPPLFVLLFTGLTQVLATWGNPHRSVTSPHPPPPPNSPEKKRKLFGVNARAGQPPLPPPPSVILVTNSEIPLSWSRARIFKHLRGAGIDSVGLCCFASRYENPIYRTGLPGYIGWRNRFLGIDS